MSTIICIPGMPCPTCGRLLVIGSNGKVDCPDMHLAPLASPRQPAYAPVIVILDDKQIKAKTH